MANQFKVTIPEAGYYSCGTYTDHRGKTVPYLEWVGETIPDNFESTEELWFFKYGEEQAPGTIIIYPWGERLEKAAKHYFEETYLDIKDEQVFDSLMDDLQDGLFDSEQGEEAGEYNWQAEYWHNVYQSLVTKPDSPGLTAEMIVQRGWRLSTQIDGMLFFKKGDIMLDAGRGAFLDVTGDRIKIITTDEGYYKNVPNCSVKFLGICKTIEEFDMICRMIDLKV